MSGAAPLLAAHDLEVRFGRGSGGFRLRVPALELRAGETLTVLGPNGAGKSTLLQALAGLRAPAQGQVVRAPDREVALVFQHPVVFAGSVAHNAGLALWARGVPRAERRARVAAALEEFGIASLAGRDAATLSGGESRRLALARAFAARPDVLLLDEPFDDLDPAGREALSADLRRVVAERGVAAAMVTHDLRQALLLADRIAVLRDGALVQVGERDHVLRRPADPGVARLVGMANLLPARALEPAGGLGMLALANGARLGTTARPAPGGGVVAGVRPESVELATHPGPGESRAARAEVRGVVSDGVVAAVLLDWQGVALRVHRLAGRGLARELKPGDPVWIAIPPEDVHVMSTPDEPPSRRGTF